MIRRAVGRALDRRFRASSARLEAAAESLHASIEDLAAQLAAIRSELDEARAALCQLEHHTSQAAAQTAAWRDESAVWGSDFEARLWPVLRALVEEEADHRRRLFALRSSAAYEEAYSDPQPLVSITVSTRDRTELLTTRALPSLLAQTYTHLEIIVAGDHAAPEVGEAVEALGDPRVSYFNLGHRVAVHPDQARQHHISSSMARNEAQRRAAGTWLMQFDDDDALRPTAIELLLGWAREKRVEVAYGGFEARFPDRESQVFMAFPPRWGSFSFAGALMHGGLRLFERELISAHLDVPGDMYLLRRMIRTGVSFGLLEDVVFDYYPARFHEKRSSDAVITDPWPLSEISSVP